MISIGIILNDQVTSKCVMSQPKEAFILTVQFVVVYDLPLKCSNLSTGRINEFMAKIWAWGSNN
jgi:hypothetical protein